MRKIRLSLLVLFAACAPALAADWTLIKHDGRDYVTLDNIAEFYGLAGISKVSNSVLVGSGTRTLRGGVGSSELYINNLKFILSYPIAESGGHLLVSRMDLTKLIEPVLRPSRIRNAEKIDTVVLDPGHGGHDNGAACVYGKEKDFALDVACRARTILQQHGFKVHMTRIDDRFIPLDDRVRFANQFSNAIFISIHFNSGGAAASGIETYTLAPRGVPSMMADGPRVSDLDPCPGNVRDAENMALACATHASLIVHSQLYDRGIKRARFVVIRDIKIPGVLIEGGFVSSSSDSRKLATPAYRQSMAFCIAAAAQNYRNAVGPQTPTLAGDSAQLRPVGERTGGSKADGPVVMTPTAN
jgi:N-acetylmuramoyl-L-alanine amidase